MDIIHYVDYGSQGDNRILCTKTYHRFLEYHSNRIGKATGDILYTVSRQHVTCPKCLVRMQVQKYIIARRVEDLEHHLKLLQELEDEV